MNKRQRQVMCSLLSSALLLGTPLATPAEEAADQHEYALDEYVVTANRIPVKQTEIAANVTVITREEIEKGGYSSVPDVLRKSSITLEKNSGATIPLLNGDERVLVLIDGRRMNWSHLVASGSNSGAILDLLAVENIERIEIVRGPSSSLYGSEAAGGVINIITRKAGETRTSVASEFGSWGFKRYNLTSQGKSSDISYLLTAEKKQQDSFEYKDFRTGKIRTHNDSQLDREFLTLRLDKELEGGRSLSLQFEHTEDESGFAGYIHPDGRSEYPGGYRTSLDNNVALTYQWGKDTGANNLLRVYRNHYEATYYNSLFAIDELEATGLDWQQSWKLGEKHTLVGGGEWRQESINDNSSIDESVTTGAVFAENRWSLPSNWTLSAGARYDHHSVVGGHFTSRLTANREINSTTNLYASWGQYVKNPTIAQMYSNTIYWKGNPDLDPEKGRTITLGLNTELGHGTKLQTSVYRSQIDNALDWAWRDWDNNGIEYTKYINVNKQKRQGFDLTLSQQLSPQWNIAAGYTYVKIQNQSSTETAYSNDPRTSQPNGYRLNVEYDQDKLNTGLTLRSVTGRDTSVFSGKSYLTLDMTVNYKCNSDTRIYFKGYNLTNEAYESAASYWSDSFGQRHPGQFPMPSRSFYFGLEHKI